MHTLIRLFLLNLFILLTLSACAGPETQEAENGQQQKPKTSEGNLKIATFAGGCFWCTEAYFEQLKGVEKVISGYTGGKEKNPTYKQVSYGKTSHAEAIQVFYNPNIISYSELLEVFFATHDPTTLNRQGPDVGKQYRSAVYYGNETEKKQTEAYIRKLQDAKKYLNPIVTEVKPVTVFYKAEDYHQDYYKLNPNDPYVQSVAKPKVIKFEKEFKSRLK